MYPIDNYRNSGYIFYDSNHLPYAICNEGLTISPKLYSLINEYGLTSVVKECRDSADLRLHTLQSLAERIGQERSDSLYNTDILPYLTYLTNYIKPVATPQSSLISFQELTKGLWEMQGQLYILLTQNDILSGSERFIIEMKNEIKKVIEQLENGLFLLTKEYLNTCEDMEVDREEAEQSKPNPIGNDSSVNRTLIRKRKRTLSSQRTPMSIEIEEKGSPQKRSRVRSKNQNKHPSWRSFGIHRDGYAANKLMYASTKTRLAFEKVKETVNDNLSFQQKENSKRVREKIEGLFNQPLIPDFVKIKPVNIPDSNFKQYGVFATQEIQKGTFLGIYAGKVLSDRDIGKAPQIDNMYFFDLIPPFQKFIVDANKYGNWTRFINHGKQPSSFTTIKPGRANLKPHYYFYRKIPYIVLVAKVKIPAGAELLFDYGPRYWQDKKPIDLTKI